jgi:hypothetical protein
MMHSLRRAKDHTISCVVLWFINRQIACYGIMTSLKINSEQKTFVFTLDLRGEASPIDVEGDYSIKDSTGEMRIEISNVRVSREWMARLAGHHLAQSPIQIPVSDPRLALAVRLVAT